MSENYLKSFNNAIASVEMEGYQISDEEKQICIEMIDGKITKEQFIKKLLERCNM